MYHALTVAKYVIDYTHRNGGVISNLKLQKVLYFLQAEFLVTLGDACFMDKIEAWDIGPVVPNVYRQFTMWGSASIPEAQNDVAHSVFCEETILPEHRSIINRMVDALANYSAWSLTKITLNQAPWKNAHHEAHTKNEITWDSLRTYFSDENGPNPCATYQEGASTRLHWVSAIVQDKDGKKPRLLAMNEGELSLEKAMEIVARVKEAHAVLSVWIDVFDETNTKQTIFHECYIDAFGTVWPTKED